MKRATRHSPPAPHRRRTGGFSLLEVLVTILILSFGLLGMVGLQAAALQGNREARLQSIAVSQARELAEMMRGNKEIARSNDATTNPYKVDRAAPSLVPAAYTCLATGCTSNTNVAKAQVYEWLARVDAALPGAKVKVCFDKTPFDSNGQPQWTCDDDTTATMVIKLGWTRIGGNRTQAQTDTATFALASVRPTLVLPVTPGNE